MTLGKRARWILVFAILLSSLLVLLTRVDFVQATLSDVHAATVLLRVENELMRKTSAGQYYDDLFWKHSAEIGKILQANPEHEEVLLSAIRLFIPELEALLEGNGDSAYITSEHVERLQAELDWFAARGSTSLQEDIRKEEERFPLEKFVGMTMSDAWDFINSKWTPDMALKLTIEPDPLALQTSTPDAVVQPDPIPESAVMKTLVPGSNGEWAYYIYKGVYFEYPASGYYIVSELENGVFDLVLSAYASKNYPYEIFIHIWKLSPDEKDNLNPEHWYPAESIVWQRSVEHRDFEGLDFMSRIPTARAVNLNTARYNQRNQIAIHVDSMYYINDESWLPNELDDSLMLNQRYVYFQHIVDSIDLQIP